MDEQSGMRFVLMLKNVGQAFQLATPPPIRNRAPGLPPRSDTRSTGKNSAGRETMNKERFKELSEALRQANAVRRGEAARPAYGA
jgi:hypothetical protein